MAQLLRSAASQKPDHHKHGVRYGPGFSRSGMKMPHRVRGTGAYTRLRSIASTLHAPPPANTKYRQAKQNRIAALPPFRSGV
jgi:hypothetical protein